MAAEARVVDVSHNDMARSWYAMAYGIQAAARTMFAA